MLCCGYTLTEFPISTRLTSLALWQSIDCPCASKATLMNMDKYFMWIHYERLHNHNKANYNKTVCIFLGIYCTFITAMATVEHMPDFENTRAYRCFAPMISNCLMNMSNKIFSRSWSKEYHPGQKYNHGTEKCLITGAEVVQLSAWRLWFKSRLVWDIFWLNHSPLSHGDSTQLLLLMLTLRRIPPHLNFGGLSTRVTCQNLPGPTF